MDYIVCACGCGKTTEKYDKQNRERHYIRGHGKIGKLHSDETKKKQRESHKNVKLSNNPNWKGGKKITKGYVKIKLYSHSFADAHGYIFEHRVIWEQHNKASLLPWGIVHHKNGIRHDNRIENLHAMTRGSHNVIHFTRH